MNEDDEIWATLHRHLQSIFDGDVETYCATTAADLSLFEWWVTPHRQDGLDFHRFMIAHRWAGAGADWRYDLLEPRLQRYGDCAIVSYTFMLSIASTDGVTHRTHNESRVLVRQDGVWKVVHVHKSPAAPGQHP
jgi:ketosteroid isomerase-like protein